MRAITVVCSLSGVILASTLLLSGCGGDSSSDTTSTGGTTTVTFSAQSYYSTNCASCHGANGEGTASGSALNDNNESGIVTTLTDIKNNVTSTPGYTPMKPVVPDTFKSEDIAALASYIFTTFNTSNPAPTFNAASFYSTNCAGCHGADAKGGLYSAIDGESASSIETVIKGVRDGVTTTSGYTEMKSFVPDTLTDTDISSLASYIKTL